jgi:nucleoside-diphosphate-sugar epimerase
VVHSQGTQTRDYVFLEDALNAMTAAATAPDVNHRLINVGSGAEVSVRELVRLVIEVTGSKAEIVYNPRTDPGVSRMKADLTLARQKLNYQPRTSLEEGLRRTLERDARFGKEITARTVKT